ncbi:hypothetical protein GPECTOR_21g611 [Gonium pectorale]|uniref:Uncharacterized protein n=1 Tax=Gonium pectorale TaxID=33097 RepID=A0A150GI95_GONPE|nr:hypothetical protein GPECTOR_21g611 [Gonium pectorale]|eukprot:KXZ49385.1 hypothetical protein GPECTOR_21g611 [Gonium pectorale]
MRSTSPQATPNTTATSTSASGAPAATSIPGAGGPFELPGRPDELIACLNSHQPNSSGTTWRAAMRDSPPYLRVVGMWWSAKVADVPLTITTQLSWNRKWQLKAMCRSWGGPIAAVLHLPVPLPRLLGGRRGGRLDDVRNATMARAVATVAAFHARMEAQHPCKMDLMLLAEPYQDSRSMVLYPVNTLRNYARLMARTPLIGIVDVDLMVSASLRQEMRDPAAAAAYVSRAEAAVAAAAAGRTGAAYSTGASRTAGVPHGHLNRTSRVPSAAIAAAGTGATAAEAAGAAGAAEGTAATAAGAAAAATAATATLAAVAQGVVAGGGVMAQTRRLAAAAAAAAVGSGATGAAAAGGGSGRVAFVLPAFVTRGGSLEEQIRRADKVVAGGKEVLKQFYDLQKVMRFDPGSTGHVATNYGAWFRSTQPYTVTWSDRYEPWLIIDRLSSSWADSRFRGYGKNKIVHIRTMAYEGYDLVVHPSAYLIHRPHGVSSSSTAHWRSATHGRRGRNSSMYGHNTFLYKMVQRDMAFGNYTPPVDPATAACRQLLSWWKGAPKTS